MCWSKAIEMRKKKNMRDFIKKKTCTETAHGSERGILRIDSTFVACFFLPSALETGSKDSKIETVFNGCTFTKG